MAAALEGSMRRLAASTRQTLPSGNASDLLAWQLRQWFEALEYPLDQEPVTGANHTDLIVRVPARRQYARTLVRAQAVEIRSPDVDLALKVLAGRSVEEVWLVTLRRISPAAREAAQADGHVFLYTLDELIEEAVSFESYFDWLDDQAEEADIDRLYVPLAVTINEIDGDGALRSNSTYEDIALYVDQWLQDSDGEHLSLLGEFGTGKSWFALKHAHDMVGEYRDAQRRSLERPRVPLVVRLREYAQGFKDIGALLTEFVFREHKIKIGSFAVLETLNRMGRLLFIFDGFDEMAARVDQQKMVDNFWALAAVLGPGSKAILTCRSEYFHFAQQAREVLGGKLRGSLMREVFETARFQVATLQMFDEKRLREVLSRRADPALAEAVLASPTLVDLGRRPVMIDLLLEAMPNLESESADLAQVYYQAVQRKMERDIRGGRTFTSMADKIFFLCEVSWEMLSKNQLKIHYKQIPERIRAYFGANAAAEGEDHWRHDLLSQTMLVRDDDGFYRPAHKSLVEFFSAYKLSAAIGALKDSYVEAARQHGSVNKHLQAAAQRWSSYFQATEGGGRTLAPLARFAMESPDQLAVTWDRLSLNDSISELLFLLCGQPALLDVVKAQIGSEGEGGSVTARALEVVAFLGDLSGADLAGATLRGCRLRKRNLSRADLSGSTWSGGTLDSVSLDYAALRKARFTAINLAEVTFREANLSNSSFEDVHFYIHVLAGAWCVRAKEEILIAVLADRRVVAISPRASKVQKLVQAVPDSPGKSRQRMTEWLLERHGNHQLAGLGEVSFAGDGWQLNKAWHEGRRLAEGIRSEFDFKDFAQGDVEVLQVRVVHEETGEVLLDRKFADSSALGTDGTRALAISKSGTRLATVSVGSGSDLKERGAIAGRNRDEDVPLQGFDGSLFGRGPETLDLRGASFSPDESLLAICERPDVIGFWQTDTGVLVGRLRFYPAAQGCVVDGATGLEPAFVTANRDEKDGWIFEAPV